MNALLRRSVLTALTLSAFVTLKSQDSIPAPTELSELEVTASRVASGSNAVYSINTSTAAERGISTLADAVRRLPAAEIRDYGGAGGLKTVSVRGLGAAHTAVVYDGVAVSDCQSGAVDISRFSIDALETISLAAGESDNFSMPARNYSSAATLILTGNYAAPGSPFRSWVKVRGGSFGLIDPFIRVDVPMGEKVAATVLGEYSRADNRYPFTLINGTQKTREKRIHNGTESYRAEANMGVTLPFGRLRGKFSYYDSHRQLPGPVTLYNPGSNENLNELNLNGQIIGNFDIKNFSIQGIIKYSSDHSDYSDSSPVYPGGKLDQRYRQKEFYVSAVGAWRPAGYWSLTYGIDYFRNTLTSNLPNEVEPARDNILQTLGLRFRNREWTATARALVSIYRHSASRGESQTDYTRLSPSVSVSFSPGNIQWLNSHISYKNIFRLPTFAESYFGVVNGAGSLRPENAHELNLGLTSSISGQALNGQISADAFFNMVTDKLIAIPRNMFLWSMTNLGKVHIYGVNVSMEGSYSFSRRQSLLLTGTYTYQRVRPVTDAEDPYHGKQAAYSPRHTGSASLSWENPWCNAVIHFTGASERFATNSNQPSSRLPGFVECGAGLYRSFNIKGVKAMLRADINNMFNAQYSIIARYPMPGRWYSASVEFSF